MCRSARPARPQTKISYFSVHHRVRLWPSSLRRAARGVAALRVGGGVLSGRFGVASLCRGRTSTCRRARSSRFENKRKRETYQQWERTNGRTGTCQQCF